MILRGVIRVYGWQVLSYCLMSNHVHLVVETPEANLGDGMQRLHGHYGSFFNRRYDTWGHVFRKPYGVKPIKDDAQLLTVIGYVAANPVDAGLSRRPELWPRSSHAAILAGDGDGCFDRARLLWRMEGITGDGPRGYAACVEAAVERAAYSGPR